MAETATESSSGEDLSVSPASESKKKERNERQTLASMAEDLQRNVISSTDSAIRSARSLHHNSSAHFRNLQEFVANAKSHYKTYEDTFFNTVKEHPVATVGVGVASGLLLLRGPRRFLFRHTLGRLRSEEAQFVKAEKNVKELSLSVDVMKNESRKLLERAALAEKDMKYGHTELMKAGNQIQHLAKSVYKVEAQAADLVDGLRETPGREALKLRAEVASVLSHLKKQRVELDKRIMQISDLGVPV
ncbi:uncharacterized protein LOC21385922 [Morus notabilis]|uniref:uncharacterized protein LOC21385922 n=1 Tax=Morus notabilis TaxID=981085 RepID=UPI000CED63AD|nr:uncharacterized protein LOC21385922 [Morus notabilis]